MISLEKVFKNLAFSELANVSIGDATTGIIAPAHYERVASCVQLGLTALHQRFLIRAGQVVIRNYPHIGRYYLDYAYARSNSDSLESTLYIEDTTTNPFADNVLKIEQIFDEVGREHSLNDSSAPDPIFTPEYNCIAMTPVVGNALWSVVYRADHEVLSVDENTVLSTIEVKIPQQYLEPLQAYASGKLLGVDGGAAAMVTYETLCARIEQQNLDIDDNDIHTRLEDNGWV